MPARPDGRRIVAALAMLVPLAVAADASAATRDVCPSGCTYATPQAAVDAAAAGDTITIAPGTYGALRFGPTFDTDGLTIRGIGDTRPVLAAGIELANGAGHEIEDLTIENVVVRGTTAGDPTAVIGMRGSAGGTRDFTLRDSLVDGEDDRTVPGFGGRNLIFARNMTGVVTIEGNELTRGRGWCTFDTGCNGGGTRFPDEIVFTGNHVHDNDSWIALRGKSPAERIPKVTFSGNVVEDIGPSATAFGAAVKAFNVADATVTGNRFADVGLSGTHPAGEAQYGAALALKAVTTMAVTGNVFTGSQQGFALDPGTTEMPAGTVSGNTFRDNAYAIYVPATANATGATFTANAIVGSTVEQVHHGGTGTLQAPRNWWGCNAGPGAPGCGVVGGDVAVGPRVVLGLASTAGQLLMGQTATVTATVGRDSAGDPVGGLPEQAIALATDVGALSSAGGPAAGGSVSAQFTSYVAATSTVSATLDGQSVSLPISVVAPPQPEPEPAPAPQPQPQPQPVPSSQPSTNPSLGRYDLRARSAPLGRRALRAGSAQRLLTLRCEQTACRARFALDLRHRGADGERRTVALDPQTLELAAGRPGALAVELPRAARRALLAGGTARVTVKVTVDAASGGTLGSSRHVVRLRAAEPRRRG